MTREEMRVYGRKEDLALELLGRQRMMNAGYWTQCENVLESRIVSI
jgi:hypothetical protein